MLVLMSCSDTEIPIANQIKETSKTDSLISIENEKPTSQAFQKFPTVDTLTYSFFSNINDVERFIDPKQGVYCLEPNQGASLQIEKLFSKEDLMGKTPFLFLCRDFDFIKNQVFLNPKDFDFCNDNTEGYFIFDLKEKQTVLEDVYNICIGQEGSTVNQAILLNYKTIDQQLRKSVVVSFTNKQGDSILLKFYFTMKGERMILSIIDLSDCGV